MTNDKLAKIEWRELAEIKLDKTSSTPLYEQLRAQIEALVRNGLLKPGQRLPSTREYARFLGVSRRIVLTCYQLLSYGSMGYKKRAGTYLPKYPSEKFSPQTQGLPQQALQPDAPALVGDEHLHAFGQSSLFCKAWNTCIKSSSAKFSHDRNNWSIEGFSMRARISLAEFLRRKRGLSCEADQLFIFTSLSQAMFCIGLLLDVACETVWIEEPSHPKITSIFSSLDSNTKPVDLSVDWSQVATASSAPLLVYAAPCLRLPTGTSHSDERRVELAAYLKQKNAFLIEHELNCEFARKILLQEQLADRTFYIAGFSPLTLPLRDLTVMVIPNEFVGKMNRLYTYMGGYPIYVQRAFEEFIAERIPKRVLEVLQLAKQKQDLILEQLYKNMPPHCWLSPAVPGMPFVINLPAGTDDRELVNQLRQADIHTIPLSCFYQSVKSPGLVVGYVAALNEDLMPKWKLLLESVSDYLSQYGSCAGNANLAIPQEGRVPC